MIVPGCSPWHKHGNGCKNNIQAATVACSMELRIAGRFHLLWYIHVGLRTHSLLITSLVCVCVCGVRVDILYMYVGMYVCQYIEISLSLSICVCLMYINRERGLGSIYMYCIVL